MFFLCLLDTGELRGKRVKIPCGPAAVSEEPKPKVANAAATETKSKFMNMLLHFGKAGNSYDAQAGRPAFHIL